MEYLCQYYKSKRVGDALAKMRYLAEKDWRKQREEQRANNQQNNQIPREEGFER